MPGYVTLLPADFAFISVWRFKKNTKTQIKKENWKTKKNKDKKKKKLKRAGNLRKSQTKEKVGTGIGILSRFHHFKLNRIKSNLIGWVLALSSLH